MALLNSKFMQVKREFSVLFQSALSDHLSIVSLSYTFFWCDGHLKQVLLYLFVNLE